MFLENRFVYVDLNKTGTVTVLNALRDLGLEPIRFRHHEKPSQEETAGREVLATIRDPWSYYLSLWAYGVKHGNMSGPHRALTQFALSRGRGVRVSPVGGTLSIATYVLRALTEDWAANKENLYGSHSPKCFQSWLPKVLDRRSATILSGPYSGSSVSRFVGLYTYRYCNMLCFGGEKLHGRGIKNLDDLKAWESEARYVDRFIQTSEIRTELGKHLADMGLVSDAEHVSRLIPEKPRNKTLASESVRSEYYTQDLIDMVTEREALLIDKFGYRF